MSGEAGCAPFGMAAAGLFMQGWDRLKGGEGGATPIRAKKQTTVAETRPSP